VKWTTPNVRLLQTVSKEIQAKGDVEISRQIIIFAKNMQITIMQNKIAGGGASTASASNANATAAVAPEIGGQRMPSPSVVDLRKASDSVSVVVPGKSASSTPNQTVEAGGKTVEENDDHHIDTTGMSKQQRRARVKFEKRRNAALAKQKQAKDAEEAKSNTAGSSESAKEVGGSGNCEEKVKETVDSKKMDNATSPATAPLPATPAAAPSSVVSVSSSSGEKSSAEKSSVDKEEKAVENDSSLTEKEGGAKDAGSANSYNSNVVKSGSTTQNLVKSGNANSYDSNGVLFESCAGEWLKNLDGGREMYREAVHTSGNMEGEHESGRRRKGKKEDYGESFL
jgi:hypothetical protein